MLDPRGGPISGAEELVERLHAGPFRKARCCDRSASRSSTSPPPANLSDAAQRDLLDTLQQYNSDHFDRCGGNQTLASRIASYELAYKMQSTAPEAIDLADESEATLKLYGLDREVTRVVRPAVPASPAGWSSAACGSSRFIPAATTSTRAGTPTAIWSSTINCTPTKPTSRWPA